MKNCTSASDLAPWGAVSGSVGRETTHPWGAVLCCEVARGGGSRDGGRESPANECLTLVAREGGEALPWVFKVSVWMVCVAVFVCAKWSAHANTHNPPRSATVRMCKGRPGTKLGVAGVHPAGPRQARPK